MTKGAKRFRSITCGLIAFLLSLAVTLLMLLSTLKLTVLNPSFTVRVLEHSEYSEALHKELKEHFISYGSATNIDESFFDEVFNSIITKDQISATTEIAIRNFYSYDVNTDVDTTNLETRLKQALYDYAAEKQFETDAELESNINTISKELCDLYKAYVGLFNSSYFKTGASMLRRYSPWMDRLIIAVAVCALIAVIIIRLSFQRAKNYLRFFIYAFSSSTLMLIVGPAIALIMRVGSRINIANLSLYSFASSFINYIFICILISAAVPALITALLSVWRYKKIHRR